MRDRKWALEMYIGSSNCKIVNSKSKVGYNILSNTYYILPDPDISSILFASLRKGFMYNMLVFSLLSIASFFSNNVYGELLCVFYMFMSLVNVYAFHWLLQERLEMYNLPESIDYTYKNLRTSFIFIFILTTTLLISG